MIFQLFVEAFVVAVILVVMYKGVSLFNCVPQRATLFVSGFLTHFLFEAAGANAWYCKNGVACL